MKRALHCDEQIGGAALRCGLDLGHNGLHFASVPRDRRAPPMKRDWIMFDGARVRVSRTGAIYAGMHGKRMGYVVRTARFTRDGKATRGWSASGYRLVRFIVGNGKTRDEAVRAFVKDWARGDGVPVAGGGS